MLLLQQPLATHPSIRFLQKLINGKFTNSGGRGNGIVQRAFIVDLPPIVVAGAAASAAAYSVVRLVSPSREYNIVSLPSISANMQTPFVRGWWCLVWCTFLLPTTCVPLMWICFLIFTLRWCCWWWTVVNDGDRWRIAEFMAHHLHWSLGLNWACVLWEEELLQNWGWGYFYLHFHFLCFE